MEVFDAIKKRRSIKKYKDVPIDWDTIGFILDAGRLAPSAGNLQPWKFIVVLNPVNRNKIAKACYNQDWMATAPVHIVVCAEMNKMSRFYGVRGERLYSVQSCSLAAQNMLLEAVDLGLDGCFVSAFDEEMIKNITHLPDFVRPQMVLTIGYADERVPVPPKYSLNDIVNLESFDSKVRDIEAYVRYAWARRVQNVVEYGKKAVGSLAKKSGEITNMFKEKVKEKHKELKEKKEDNKKDKEDKDPMATDFRYER